MTPKEATQVLIIQECNGFLGGWAFRPDDIALQGHMAMARDLLDVWNVTSDIDKVAQRAGEEAEPGQGDDHAQGRYQFASWVLELYKDPDTCLAILTNRFGDD